VREPHAAVRIESLGGFDEPFDAFSDEVVEIDSGSREPPRHFHDKRAVVEHEFLLFTRHADLFFFGLSFRSAAIASRLGMVLPRSHRFTDTKLTPRTCANRSCVNPRRWRSALIWVGVMRFFDVALFRILMQGPNVENAGERIQDDEPLARCPFCGDETTADEVDVGIGTIRGPEACTACGAYQNDNRDWQPPAADHLPQEAFERIMREFLALRGVEAAVRQIIPVSDVANAQDFAGPRRSWRWLRRNLNHLDKVRSPAPEKP
jgi:hypothetical protein